MCVCVHDFKRKLFRYNIPQEFLSNFNLKPVQFLSPYKKILEEYPGREFLDDKGFTMF